MKSDQLEYWVRVDAQEGKIRFVSGSGLEVQTFDIMRSPNGLVIPIDVLLMMSAMQEQGVQLKGFEYPFAALLN
ncbi:MAG: hypothetical protein HUJ55_04450 [Ileibacterium sp.]|nr:hypothetical protein [Ileibacterium sp.]